MLTHDREHNAEQGAASHQDQSLIPLGSSVICSNSLMSSDWRQLSQRNMAVESSIGKKSNSWFIMCVTSNNYWPLQSFTFSSFVRMEMWVHACMLNHFSSVPPLATLRTIATRLLCPCDSPGKNTGVGCHALLQGIFPTQGLNSHLTSPALTC